MATIAPTLRRASLLAAAALMGLFTVSACDDSDDPPGTSTDAVDGSGDSGMSGDSGPGTDTTTVVGPCTSTAGQDDDGDGLLNGIEDANLNCVVDAGETDPDNPDTDGDTLLDGEEDLNGNGRVDEGEFDPRASDTDGDGIPDNLEPLAAVCLKSLIRDVERNTSPEASTLLAAASDAYTLERRGARAATFQIDDEVFGYVVRRDGQSSDVRQESGRALIAVGQAGVPVTLEFQDTPFDTWSLPHSDPSINLAPRTAVRVKLDMGEVATSLAALRDDLAESVAGESLAPSSAASSATCANDDEAVLWQTTVVRTAGEVVVVGAMTCRSKMTTATYFTVDDTTNTTMFAPTRPTVSYQPDEGHCEELAALEAARPVDFLWVIDTSGSMADEQTNVASAADLFFETLIGSGADWRLGVTTTEAWALDDPSIASNVDFSAHDPQLDAATALVGEGFFDESQPQAKQRFQEYVTVDRNCAKEPPGRNICGYGLESGLISGVSALTRLETDEREAFRLREDAIKAVIWVSDEDDQHFKDDTGFEPLAADDPERAARLPEVLEPYVELDVRTCAIVGDQGRDKGGVCEVLENSAQAVEGAQYGLGYLQVIEATEGYWGSICNDDLSVTIDSCVRAILGVVNSYPLEGRPLSGTIRVAVDGTEVERSRTQGWDYDAATNSIVFQGSGLLTRGSVIAVSYREWEPSGG